MEDINYAESIIQASKTLKLGGLKGYFKETRETAIKEKWSFDRYLYEILSSELKHREEMKRKGLIRKARFKTLKYLEDLDRNELPEDMAVALPELETLHFIKEGRNIVLYGNPGTGKTHCAIGLAVKACLAGYSVLYTSIPHLLTNIKECESERKLGQLQKKFEKYDLVVCDEFGYKSFDKEAAEALFNHISLRAGIKSTIITTNLSFDRWDEIFTDKIIAAAMVDRITYQSYIINMTGESYRLKATEKWMKSRKEKIGK